MDTVGTPGQWLGFLGFIAVMLALDLRLARGRPGGITTREALGWSAFWVVTALLFGAGVAWLHGPGAGMEFLSGYLLEKSLSVDNLFVFVLLFGSFQIPEERRHRILTWGVLSALVLRGAMILGGAALVARYGWLLQVFGLFLLYLGARGLLESFLEPTQPTEERALGERLSRWLPTTGTLEGDAFVVRRGGRWLLTSLGLCLVAIELSDVLFAVDSIPAVFAITRDPFVVFTSNIFAMLGLRAMYFLLEGLVTRLPHLKLALGGILVFIGAKMVFAEWFHLSAGQSLLVIVSLLGAATLASLRGAQGVTSKTSTMT